MRYASQAALGRSRRLPERLWEKPGDVLYFWQAYFDDREQLELALAVLAAYGVAAQVLEIFPVGPEWRVIRGGFRRTAGHASWGGHWLLDANEIKHVSDVVKWCLVNELTANLTGALRAFLAACTALGATSCVTGCYSMLDGLAPKTKSVLDTVMTKAAEKRTFRQRLNAFLSEEKALDKASSERIANYACGANSERRLDTVKRYTENCTRTADLSASFAKWQTIRNAAAHGTPSITAEPDAEFILKIVSLVLRFELERASGLPWIKG